ncbi:tyrosine-type recombinase/integrase [Microvirga sp. P5_D2]
MPRAVRSVKLDTRTARSRLPARKAPFFVRIGDKLQLGYWRGVKGGSWIARRYTGDGVYASHSLGPADDLREPDGTTILTFDQAQTRAKAWDAEERAAAAGVGRRGPLTVEQAIETYLVHLRAVKGSKAEATARSVARSRILPELGRLQCAALTVKRLTAWRNDLAGAPKLVRTAQTVVERATRAVTAAPEAERKRKATANRIMTVLKAALNLAYQSGEIASDDTWRRLKPFPKVDVPKMRYLFDDECRQLMAACAPDFRTLVEAALLTGCRYGELCQLRAGDVDLIAGTLHIRETKSGKPRHVALTAEGIDFFAARIAGQRPSTLVLTHADGTAWAPSHQQRPIQAASEQAELDPPVTFHDLRNTYGARLARTGVPMAVIAAQLGHADTRITERHYAHLAPNYVADMIRSHFGPIGISASNVTTLRRVS